MKLTENIKIVDLALVVDKTLIISDVHIGYEQALNKQGVMVPRFQFKDTVERLEKILKKVKPKQIIVTGDLKHEFGTISEQEWREVLKLLDLMLKYTKDIVLIEGNHDKITKVIAAKRSLKVVKQVVLGENLIMHGDVVPEIPKGIKRIIIGHEHPAVSVKDKIRIEKYKCFLAGKFRRKGLIVLPSFNLLLEGTDILQGKILSPFLKQRLDNFEVYIVGDKIYHFGKLKNLK